MNYLIPATILLVTTYGIIRKVSVYDSFVTGSKGALRLIGDIFPYLATIMIVIELVNISGIGHYIEKVLEPLLALLGIPKELSSLIIIRPLSGSGSIAMLEDIISRYGADSYIARCAAIIVSASETIFYVATIYLSQTKIKKLRYAIPVALFASFIGVIFSCLLARMM